MLKLSRLCHFKVNLFHPYFNHLIMKSKHLISLLSGFFAMALVFSCQNADEDLPYKSESLELPETLFNYAEPELPVGLADFITNDPDFNVTDAGATLGRVLFYDKKLSLTNNISCGSCHLQEKAFADVGKGSVGFEGGVTTRNSLAITNPVLEDEFFWDLRESDLKSMVLKPIENHIEMGMEDIDKLPGKIKNADYYPELFKAAFGDAEITESRIAESLRQFLSSMLTMNSKWDRGNWGSNLTAQEQEGMNVFFGQGLCYQCHSGNNFNEAEGFFGPGGGWDTRRAANIGLEEHYEDAGLGVHEANSEGVFKVPSLRNVGLTAPYMHDGRFETLDDVVDHYNENIADHDNLDERLRDWNGNPWRLQLTEQQQDALVAFLHTLTDDEFVQDKKYSDPFAQ